MNRPGLSQKVVLVTGAAGGLGSALSKAAAAEGAHLALVDRGGTSLDDLADRLGSGQTKTLSIDCDVTDEGSVDAAIARTVEHFGALDVVINNAGIFRMSGIAQASLSDWEESLAVNLTGPFLICRAAARHWLSNGTRGHVINIASIGARLGFPELTAYCASKAGLVGMSRALAEELRPRGIRVTIVYPHAMNTGRPRSEPEGEERYRLIEPETVAQIILQAATTPSWVAVEEITVYPQATSTTPRMVAQSEVGPQD